MKTIIFDESSLIKVVQAGSEIFQHSLNELAPQCTSKYCSLKATSYIPALLADFYYVKDASLVTQLTAAHLGIDFFCHIIDDLTDESSMIPVSNIHSAQLILFRSIRILLAASNYSPNFLEKFEMLASVASRAERNSLKHKTLLPFKKEDFNAMGEKSALLKITLHVLNSELRSNSEIAIAGEVLDDLFTAVQLFDDLKDCKEDRQNGMITLPISRSMIRRKHHTLEQDEMLLKDVLYIVSRAESRIARAQRRAEQIGWFAMSGVLNKLRSCIEQIVESLHTRPANQSINFGDLNTLLEKYLSPSMAH